MFEEDEEPENEPFQSIKPQNTSETTNPTKESSENAKNPPIHTQNPVKRTFDSQIPKKLEKPAKVEIAQSAKAKVIPSHIEPLTDPLDPAIQTVTKTAFLGHKKKSL